MGLKRHDSLSHLNQAENKNDGKRGLVRAVSSPSLKIDDKDNDHIPKEQQQNGIIRLRKKSDTRLHKAERKLKLFNKLKKYAHFNIDLIVSSRQSLLLLLHEKLQRNQKSFLLFLICFSFFSAM